MSSTVNYSTINDVRANVIDANQVDAPATLQYATMNVFTAGTVSTNQPTLFTKGTNDGEIDINAAGTYLATATMNSSFVTGGTTLQPVAELTDGTTTISASLDIGAAQVALADPSIVALAASNVFVLAAPGTISWDAGAGTTVGAGLYNLSIIRLA